MMELRGLWKAYDGRQAVTDLSLAVGDDEYLTLLGPSGSGKTTLLRLVAGLELPDRGRVSLNGENITSLPAHLRGLGFVQQNYALFPHMSVADNVAFGLRNRLIAPAADEAEVARRTGRIMELVGLAGLGNRMVGQISGGQKQRVSLARTLVTEPRVCLLDEPLGALDANLRERMTAELRNIRETLGVTFFHATGNEAEALAMGDRMIVLDGGRAVQIAPPDEVFHAPSDVRVARYVNSYNVLHGTVEAGAFASGELRLPVPPGAETARSVAVRYDLPTISGEGESDPPGHHGMSAAFIASEFMGSRVVYFFRTPDGSVFEVERHLSRSDPESFADGERRRLSWRASDTLFFGADGARLEAGLKEGAA